VIGQILADSSAFTAPNSLFPIPDPAIDTTQGVWTIAEEFLGILAIFLESAD
jgi:hypothetical protein